MAVCSVGSAEKQIIKTDISDEEYTYHAKIYRVNDINVDIKNYLSGKTNISKIAYVFDYPIELDKSCKDNHTTIADFGKKVRADLLKRLAKYNSVRLEKNLITTSEIGYELTVMVDVPRGIRPELWQLRKYITREDVVYEIMSQLGLLQRDDQEFQGMFDKGDPYWKALGIDLSEKDQLKKFVKMTNDRDFYCYATSIGAYSSREKIEWLWELYYDLYPLIMTH